MPQDERRHYSRAASLFFDTPLALLPAKRDEILTFWRTKLAGGTLDFEDRCEPFAVRHFDAETGVELLAQDEDDGLDETPDVVDFVHAARKQNEPARRNKIALIPLHGVMAQRISLLEAMSGGVSTEMAGNAFREAMNDQDVKAVLLHIDSPGGSSYGVTELANLIMDARGTKPIVAMADAKATSAGHWVGSAADYFYSTPSGLVGSLGVYAVHTDISQLAENEGVKVTLIAAGKNKTRGNMYEPLSEDDVSFIQSLVDDTYEQFIADVARGRRVSARTVRTSYGEGDVMTPRKALAAGMIDGIKTLAEVLAEAPKLRPRKPAAAGTRASLDGSEDERPETEGMSFTEHAEQVLAGLKAFNDRAKSLADLRAEEGRSLSEERREQIHAVLAAGETAIGSVRESVPQPESRAALEARQARWRALREQAAALTAAKEA